MKRIHIDVTCDEGFVADTLRELASGYEDSLECGEFDLECGTAVIEEYEEEEL